MSHFLKHLMHSIKHWFSNVGNTASTILSDPRVTNGLKIAQFGGKIIEEISDSKTNYQTPPSQPENSDESYPVSKEEKEIIESFKSLLDSFSKRTEQLEKKVIQFTTEFDTIKKCISQLQDEIKKQQELNASLELQINTIEINHDQRKKEIQVLGIKQKSYDNYLIFAYALLFLLIISTCFLIYKIYI